MIKLLYNKTIFLTGKKHRASFEYIDNTDMLHDSTN